MKDNLVRIKSKEEEEFDKMRSEALESIKISFAYCMSYANSGDRFGNKEFLAHLNSIQSNFITLSNINAGLLKSIMLSPHAIYMTKEDFIKEQPDD
jgi:hypothetical protein